MHHRRALALLISGRPLEEPRSVPSPRPPRRTTADVGLADDDTPAGDAGETTSK
eukprot:CAMPEP_0115054588 /NCGR_PEP_ID=MMETSP0227-20121206/4173_1 /TAXON_ID=89957 /ORGANISM="Polarella glacialis, Strain CCMP 1383" /LENGTH=53 /DNA_ID=CAMNT_0002439071 /DNA_START=32 /DNA_END=190 /DNA_ORIENTATION=-